MLIKTTRGWEMPEAAATPETVFHDRRRLVKAIAAGPILAAPILTALPAAALAAAGPYPAKRNPRYALDRAITDERIVTTYNNFYEFGSHKQIWQAAQKLKVRPWTVTIDGLVEAPITIDAHALIRKMPLEERLYRHRCVEAWSIAVPWSGFALKALVDFARPLSGAKYLEMRTFLDKSVASGQKQFWYPWPYLDGLTMAEATNELAFHRHRRLRQGNDQAERRAAAPDGAVEIRLQVGQVDHALHLHRQAAEELLGGHPGQRIRLLGEREPRGRPPALEPGDRAPARHRQARADIAL